MRRGTSVVVLRRRSPAWAVLAVLRRRLLGRARVGGSLREELLDAAQPSGALRRHDERAAALLRASTLPLYAVAGWSGLRAVGGWSGSGATTRALELAFFAGAVDGPSVRVTSSTSDRGSVRRQAVHALAALGARPADLDPEAFFAEVDGRRDALGARPWEPVGLVVDGQPSAAELLPGDDAWAVVWQGDGVVVGVVSDRVPLVSVSLERVIDVEPYVSGLAELRRLQG